MTSHRQPIIDGTGNRTYPFEWLAPSQGTLSL